VNDLLPDKRSSNENQSFYVAGKPVNHQGLEPTEKSVRRIWKYQPPPKSREADSNNQNAESFKDQRSEKAQSLRADIERVARRSYNVLITGETGTGKTLAARQIHQSSTRADKAFMELNCANLPEHLVEAELFGYRKGAFTGADREHKGLFEEADGGILFLDEIGDIAPNVQNKLLKAIDEKQVRRLGTNHYVHCDVQIIAATSRNLPEMIRQGSFREDLYCRLAVLTIETVPLRERREDIPAMIDHYLREAASTFGSGKTYWVEQEAVELLCAFDYPGNIRVLRNLIYELTSYVSPDELISIELVATTLAKLRARELRQTLRPSNAVASLSEQSDFKSGEVERENSSYGVLSKTHNAIVRELAGEGDIILPLEVCLIRQGETFKEWTARAKLSSIEAARQARNTDNPHIHLLLNKNGIGGDTKDLVRVPRLAAPIIAHHTKTPDGRREFSYGSLINSFAAQLDAKHRDRSRFLQVENALRTVSFTRALLSPDTLNKRPPTDDEQYVGKWLVAEIEAAYPPKINEARRAKDCLREGKNRGEWKPEADEQRKLMDLRESIALLDSKAQERGDEPTPAFIETEVLRRILIAPQHGLSVMAHERNPHLEQPRSHDLTNRQLEHIKSMQHVALADAREQHLPESKDQTHILTPPARTR